MPKLLDSPEANYLIQYDDGDVELVTKSDMNRLVFEHGLWDLLKTGEEILCLKAEDKKPMMQVIPGEGARSYTIQMGDYEPVHLGPHQKGDLVDALIEGKSENGNTRESLVRLYDNTRDVSVRKRLINFVAKHEPFASVVEIVDDGWLIHGHLLLTWEREFYHPGTTSKTRSGSIIGDGSTESAYKLSTDQRLGVNSLREIQFEGQSHRLSDDEMDFIVRAMWSIANAPGKR